MPSSVLRPLESRFCSGTWTMVSHSDRCAACPASVCASLAPAVPVVVEDERGRPAGGRHAQELSSVMSWEFSGGLEAAGLLALPQGSPHSWAKSQRLDTSLQVGTARTGLLCGRSCASLTMSALPFPDPREVSDYRRPRRTHSEVEAGVRAPVACGGQGRFAGSDPSLPPGSGCSWVGAPGGT